MAYFSLILKDFVISTLLCFRNHELSLLLEAVLDAQFAGFAMNALGGSDFSIPKW